MKTIAGSARKGIVDVVKWAKQHDEPQPTNIAVQNCEEVAEILDFAGWKAAYFEIGVYECVNDGLELVITHLKTKKRIAFVTDGATGDFYVIRTYKDVKKTHTSLKSIETRKLLEWVSDPMVD